MNAPEWEYDDGGRLAAGFRGEARDCVTRSIAIATKIPYQEVYDELNARIRRLRERTRYATKKAAGLRKSGSRTGVPPDVYRHYLIAQGWKWVPVMGIGTGTTMHMREGELPHGRVIVVLSGHVSAVIHGVVHDTYDPSRDGERCVYGYFVEK